MQNIREISFTQHMLHLARTPLQVHLQVLYQLNNVIRRLSDVLKSPTILECSTLLYAFKWSTEALLTKQRL